MDKEPQRESQLNIKPPASFKISAKKRMATINRVSQGDIFKEIEIIENVDVDKSVITLQKISFPFVVCLSQECDLETDFKNRNKSIINDSNLLHIPIAPAFIFDQYLSGTHWGGIFTGNNAQRRSDTSIKKIIDNEIPRFHYLKFPDVDLPELILDFKHYFSISRSVIYSQIDKRMCSLDDLFRENINHRFSYYISRIGLPEK